MLLLQELSFEEYMGYAIPISIVGCLIVGAFLALVKAGKWAINFLLVGFLGMFFTGAIPILIETAAGTVEPTSKTNVTLTLVPILPLIVLGVLQARRGER